MKTGTPTHIVDRIVRHISHAQRVVNGNHVLLIYYLVIFLFAIFDIYIRHHVERVLKEKPDEINKELFTFYKLYLLHYFRELFHFLYAFYKGTRSTHSLFRINCWFIIMFLCYDTGYF